MANSALTLCCCVLLSATAVFTEQFKFHGYQLLSVFVRDVNDVNTLNELGNRYQEIDFWREPAPQHNATVLVPPQYLAEFKDVLSSQAMILEILSDDVQSIVDAGSVRTPANVTRQRRQASGQIIDHYNYHTYSRILQFMRQLSRRYSNIKLSNLNHVTHERRSVVVVKLTGRQGQAKPVIIIEAGIHAREWISPAANLWFIEKVLQDYAAGDATARSLLDKYDWYIVPVTNPDGYEYTHTTVRLWRKNRRTFSSQNCVGVDLNRNFDIQFSSTYGASFYCNKNDYRGRYAFSEPETANIRDLFNSLINSVVAYVSVHSYSQYVLVPWGYTNYISRPSNQVELDRVTKLMTTAISNRHGKTYYHGTAYQLLNYAASGASEDWALTKKPGIIALCLELRPSANDERAFVLPANEIIGTGEELYASLIVLANETRK